MSSWWNLPSAAGGRGEREGTADPSPSAQPLATGYVDVGLIPAGAREIRIEEVAEAANFLALRSEDPEKYFLNGGWTIQWNGDYQVAGTTFTYARTGNWENLTSPGPTSEPVWIQVPASRGSGWGAGRACGIQPPHIRTQPWGLCRGVAQVPAEAGWAPWGMAARGRGSWVG